MPSIKITVQFHHGDSKVMVLKNMGAQQMSNMMKTSLVETPPDGHGNTHAILVLSNATEGVCADMTDVRRIDWVVVEDQEDPKANQQS